jgi:hypothetical protein
MLLGLSASALSFLPPIARADASDPTSSSRAEIGLRAGISANLDQWVLGTSCSYEVVPNTRWFSVEGSALVGLDRDYLSLRPSVRALFIAYPASSVGLRAVLGASLYSIHPHGEFAVFCDRTGTECGLLEVGAEIGAAVHVDWASLEGIFSFGELPVATVLLGASLRL